MALRGTNISKHRQTLGLFAVDRLKFRGYLFVSFVSGFRVSGCSEADFSQKSAIIGPFFIKNYPSGDQHSQKICLLGVLGALWQALGAPGGQKRRSGWFLASILATIFRGCSIFGPKRGSMPPLRLPKWDQNYSKICPKIVPNSM